MIAAIAGLAAGLAPGNRAQAQTLDDLPDGGEVLNKIMPTTAPRLNFANEAGRALSLADYAGNGLVVNLWATWCAPCVAEIPSFAAAAPALRQAGILVLPISIDMEGAKVVRPFYASHAITSLPILLDTGGEAMDTLNAPGIPVTIIINTAGQLVARFDGAANWNTPGALRTIRALTAPPRPHNNIEPV